jgi:hypothetical protein
MHIVIQCLERKRLEDLSKELERKKKKKKAKRQITAQSENTFIESGGTDFDDINGAQPTTVNHAEPNLTEDSSTEDTVTKKSKRTALLSYNVFPYNGRNSLYCPKNGLASLSTKQEFVIDQIGRIEHFLKDLYLLHSQESPEELEIDLQSVEEIPHPTQLNFWMQKNKWSDEVKSAYEDGWASLSEFLGDMRYSSVIRPYIQRRDVTKLQEFSTEQLQQLDFEDGDIIHVPFTKKERTIIEQELQKKIKTRY